MFRPFPTFSRRSGPRRNFRQLSATLRVYLEENMSPSRAARRLGVHEHTITNRIRAAQELLPRPIERRVCELQVALRLIRLAEAPLELP
jgi:DNA-binding PucR family transcriptional regulator